MAAALRGPTLNGGNVAEPYAARMAIARTAVESLAPDLIGLQAVVPRRDGFAAAALMPAAAAPATVGPARALRYRRPA